MKSTCGWLVLYFLCSIIFTSLANENKKYLVELGSEEKVEDHNEDEVGQDYADESEDLNEDEDKVSIDYVDSDEDESNSKGNEKKVGRKHTFGDYVQASEWIDRLNHHSIVTA